MASPLKQGGGAEGEEHCVRKFAGSSVVEEERPRGGFEGFYRISLGSGGARPRMDRICSIRALGKNEKKTKSGGGNARNFLGRTQVLYTKKEICGVPEGGGEQQRAVVLASRPQRSSGKKKWQAVCEKKNKGIHKTSRECWLDEGRWYGGEKYASREGGIGRAESQLLD